MNFNEKRIRIYGLFLIVLFFHTSFMQNTKYTILCLGDSYTIGEAVPRDSSFPIQATSILLRQGIHFSAPKIIATTGWTTDELMASIRANADTNTYDIVTLLIGVNNQYRGRSITEYREQFKALLHTAMAYSKKGPGGVFVLSIPDWGVTPFAQNDKRGEETISKEIAAFNSASRQIAKKEKVHYINITPGSRKAKQDNSLLATDGLHPSGLMYNAWAKKLAAGVKKILSQ